MPGFDPGFVLSMSKIYCFTRVQCLMRNHLMKESCFHPRENVYALKTGRRTYRCFVPSTIYTTNCLHRAPPPRSVDLWIPSRALKEQPRAPYILDLTLQEEEGKYTVCYERKVLCTNTSWNTGKYRNLFDCKEILVDYYFDQVNNFKCYTPALQPYCK